MNIAVFGSPTLKRFTDNILCRGLNAGGHHVTTQEAGAEAAIIQIHGAPTAYEFDCEIIKRLPEIASELSACIVLLHRPDEIKEKLPHFQTVLLKLPPTAALVMLGDLLIDDPFYDFTHIPRRVIPHGFFDLPDFDHEDPVVVGTHTTWGEMRSLEHAVLLLKAVLDAGPQKRVIGYLGGVPAEDLSEESVSQILTRHSARDTFIIRPLIAPNWKNDLSAAHSGTLFLHGGDTPDNFDVTFNIQLYHLDQRVRLGESSGSLHASGGIPVIFEMNGSERIEELEVVKVPYSDVMDTRSADFTAAAVRIADLINSGRYRDFLRINHRATARWNCAAVAGQYVDLLKLLVKSPTTKL